MRRPAPATRSATPVVQGVRRPPANRERRAEPHQKPPAWLSRAESMVTASCRDQFFLLALAMDASATMRQSRPMSSPCRCCTQHDMPQMGCFRTANRRFLIRSPGAAPVFCSPTAPTKVCWFLLLQQHRRYATLQARGRFRPSTCLTPGRRPPTHDHDTDIPVELDGLCALDSTSGLAPVVDTLEERLHGLSWPAAATNDDRKARRATPRVRL